jgi:hypothetical protein
LDVCAFTVYAFISSQVSISLSSSKVHTIIPDEADMLSDIHDTEEYGSAYSCIEELDLRWWLRTLWEDAVESQSLEQDLEVGQIDHEEFREHMRLESRD